MEPYDDAVGGSVECVVVKKAKVGISFFSEFQDMSDSGPVLFFMLPRFVPKKNPKKYLFSWDFQYSE